MKGLLAQLEPDALDGLAGGRAAPALAQAAPEARASQLGGHRGGTDFAAARGLGARRRAGSRGGDARRGSDGRDAPGRRYVAERGR